MNKKTCRLLPALVLGSLVAFGPRLAAAEPPAAKPEPGRSMDRTERMKAMAAELKLTEQQKEKLRPILKDESEKMRTLWSDTKLTRDQKMAKAKELREASREKVKLVLTPEQMQKWDKLRDPNRLRRDAPVK